MAAASGRVSGRRCCVQVWAGEDVGVMGEDAGLGVVSGVTVVQCDPSRVVRVLGGSGVVGVQVWEPDARDGMVLVGGVSLPVGLVVDVAGSGCGGVRVDVEGLVEGLGVVAEWTPTLAWLWWCVEGVWVVSGDGAVVAWVDAVA